MQWLWTIKIIIIICLKLPFSKLYQVGNSDSREAKMKYEKKILHRISLISLVQQHFSANLSLIQTKRNETKK